MSKHLTEIELFEYSNQLIEDKVLLEAIKSHLNSCKECQAKLAVEQKVDLTIQQNLEVEKQINVTNKVLNYFEKPAVKLVGVDVGWAVLVVFFVSALLIVGEVTSFNNAIPELTYTTVIASAISALLLVDFLFKYLKYKKS